MAAEAGYGRYPLEILDDAELVDKILASETITPEIFTAEKGKRPITDYYSAENELQFILDHGDLSLEELHFYLQENIEKFLGEFAGKIPYTRVTYTIEDGTLKYAGIDILDMLENTTRAAGPGSREYFENVGLAQAYRSLLDPEDPALISGVISPPKDWDYLFTFINERSSAPALGKDIVTMHAVRTPELRGTLTNSQLIAATIFPESQFTSAEQFLTTPFIYSENRSNTYVTSVDDVLQAVGLNPDQIAASRLFEQAVDTELRSLINTYVEGMLELAGSSQFIPAHEKQARLQSLQDIISTTFVIAQDIKKNIDATLNTNKRSITDIKASEITVGFDPSDFQSMYAYAQDKPAFIEGGGSCPVVSMDGAEGYLSQNEMYQAMQEGISFEEALQRKQNKQYELEVSGEKITSCPDCGKKDVVLQAADINKGILCCDNPSCNRHKLRNPIRAENEQERFGIRCVWEGAKPKQTNLLG